MKSLIKRSIWSMNFLEMFLVSLKKSSSARWPFESSRARLSWASSYWKPPSFRNLSTQLNLKAVSCETTCGVGVFIMESMMSSEYIVSFISSLKIMSQLKAPSSGPLWVIFRMFQKLSWLVQIILITLVASFATSVCISDKPIKYWKVSRFCAILNLGISW